MRAVVLDTNIIVSAGLKLGSVPYRIVMDWVLAGQVQAVTCPSVVREYREVLWRPKFMPHGFPPVWIEQLIEGSLQLSEPAFWPRPLPDPKDAIFLALAKTSGAWLVTGNLKHFPTSTRNGVTVIGPGEYLERLDATPA